MSTTSTDGQLAAEFGAMHAFSSVSPSPSQLSLSPDTRGNQWPSSAASFTSIQSHPSIDDLKYQSPIQTQSNQSTPIIEISKRMNPPSSIQLPPSSIQLPLPGVSSFDPWDYQNRIPETISPGLGPYDHILFSGMSSPATPGDMGPGITIMNYHVSHQILAFSHISDRHLA
jgi:hypothetical protein